jgi:hypothetical protein
MSILLEAAEIIEGDREQTYGSFDVNLNNIAVLWNNYLCMLGYDTQLTGKDVCLMMVLLKICRETNSHKRDNLVDICGYTALAAKLEEKQAAQAPEEQQHQEAPKQEIEDTL